MCYHTVGTQKISTVLTSCLCIFFSFATGTNYLCVFNVRHLYEICQNIILEKVGYAFGWNLRLMFACFTYYNLTTCTILGLLFNLFKQKTVYSLFITQDTNINYLSILLQYLDALVTKFFITLLLKYCVFQTFDQTWFYSTSVALYVSYNGVEFEKTTCRQRNQIYTRNRRTNSFNKLLSWLFSSTYMTHTLSDTHKNILKHKVISR